MDIEATFKEAKEAGIVGPGFVGTYADILEALDPHIPDEDGEQALMRHLEGGWHRGYYYDR